jgi:hypothetical protein
MEKTHVINLDGKWYKLVELKKEELDQLKSEDEGDITGVLDDDPRIPLGSGQMKELPTD